MEPFMRLGQEVQKDFLELIIGEVGEACFQEDLFEEIATEKKEEEDFYCEEDGDEAETLPTIKTAAFNANINIGPAARPPQPTDTPQLSVDSYAAVFGFNNGSKTIEIVRGKLCRAVGCNIFLQNAIYFGHNSEICILEFDQQRNVLCSGSNGRCAEIIKWQCEEEEGKVVLTQLQKFSQPLKSLGVAFLVYTDNYLISVTRFNLHQSSALFLFDNLTNKRTNSDLKLGKVRNVLIRQDLLIANEKGLHKLLINQNASASIEPFYDKEGITASEKLDEELVIIGLLSGGVEIIGAAGFVIRSNQIHEGLVSQIKVVKKGTVITVGGSDQRIVVSTVYQKDKNIVKLQQIKMELSVKTILLAENLLFCGLKNGQIQTFSIDSLAKLHPHQSEQSPMIYTSDPTSKQQLLYNRFTKKHLYTISGLKQAILIDFNEQSEIAKTASISLKDTGEIFEMHGNLIAYVHEERQRKSKIGLQLKEPSICYTLLIEDYTDGKFQTELSFTESTPCCLKYNCSGNRLAIGFSSGQISIYDSNNSQQLLHLCDSPNKGKQHSKPLQEIIWSEDDRYIKTISEDNLLFYQLAYSSSKETHELKINIDKGVKQAKWTQMGKFNWRNQKLWARAGEIAEYNCLKEAEDYIMACHSTGYLKVCTNPATNNLQELCRLFTSEFTCAVLPLAQPSPTNPISLAIMHKGIFFTTTLQNPIEEQE